MVVGSVVQLAFAEKATERSIEKPTGVKNGQIMLLSLWTGTVGLAASSVGWTVIRKTEGNGMTVTTMWKKYEGEAGPYVVKLGGESSSAGHASAYENVNANAPVNISSGQSNALSVNQTAPTITPTVENCLIVMTGANTNGTANSAFPAEYTNRNGANGELLADHLQEKAEATGAKTATLAEARINAAQLIAFTPAEEAAAPSTGSTMQAAKTGVRFQPTGGITA